MSRPLSNAPPPVNIIPFSIISDANSGGVFSKVDFIASTIEFIGSFNASLTSAELISIVLGNPDIKSLPLICMFCSWSSLKVDPMLIFTSSAVLSPIARLYVFLT